MNEVALFATPNRSDYQIPEGSVSKVYNIYAEMKVDIDFDVSVDPGAIDVDIQGPKVEIDPFNFWQPIKITGPSLDVDVRAPSIDIDNNSVIEGDFVPIVACNDYEGLDFYNVCGIAQQQRNDSGVDIVNINFPGLSPGESHSAVKNEENLKNSPELCAAIP
ncbi:MAG: hypothetical protein H0T73_02505 [Ardenticatenales bacterium]|nr:hypothetical protein [Ardenticatenales bacterium]